MVSIQCVYSNASHCFHHVRTIDIHLLLERMLHCTSFSCTESKFQYILSREC